jgi:hypothetical protein
MTRKPSGIFETRTALSDFPEKPVFFKRSDFVAAQMPPSNEHLDELVACVFYLTELRNGPYVPDKTRKLEIQRVFPKLGRKAVDFAFALASDGKRGRRRKN